MRATERVLGPLAEATGGSVRWIVGECLPDIRRVRASRDLAGRGWIGLADRRGSVVTGLEQTPLMPGWLLVLLALGGLLLAWRAEGR